MGRRRNTEEVKKPQQNTEKFILPDHRCEGCYYWRSTSGYWNTGLFCCHHMLDTGKPRIQITPTKCGSFVSKESMPKRKPEYQDVPMIQWGCGGIAIVRKGER